MARRFTSPFKGDLWNNRPLKQQYSTRNPNGERQESNMNSEFYWIEPVDAGGFFDHTC
jgi:hypothetical protein